MDPDAPVRYNPKAIAKQICSTHRKKVGLQPVMEKLLKFTLGLGPGIDVKVTEEWVTLWRNRLFAHFRPSSRRYVDIGLAVPLDTKPVGRLKRTGIVTGRDRTNKFMIRVWKLGDVNAEVRKWLKTVYELDWQPRARASKVLKPLLPQPPASWRSKLKVNYSLAPRDEWIPGLLANLKNTTGKTLEEWVKLVMAQGGRGRRERVKWLTVEQGLGKITARAIMDHAEGKLDKYNSEALVRAQLSGLRQGAAPIYEKLAQMAVGVGPEMRITPLERSIALRRNTIFAQIRLLPWEVAFELVMPEGVPPSDRLIESTVPRRDRITHHTSFRTLEEVDKEVAGWIKAAYDHDALP